MGSGDGGEKGYSIKIFKRSFLEQTIPYDRGWEYGCGSGFCREISAPKLLPNQTKVLLSEVSKTKSWLNFSLTPAKAPTGWATINRTIPLVFALLRPHCRVVSSLYVRTLSSR